MQGENSIRLSDKFAQQQKHQFFKMIFQSYVDAYNIVAQVLSGLQENSIMIDLTKLVTELQLSVQEIYHQGAIRYMNSCNIEILYNALGRFSELGVCHIQQYESVQGGVNKYI